MSATKPHQVQNADRLSLAMTLRRMFTGYWISQSIYAIAKLGVADLLSAGPQSVDQLARSLRVDQGALYRMMRTLSSYGLFTEDEQGLFQLTALGSLLRTDVPGSMRAMAIWNGELPYKAWGAVLHTLETGQPALSHALGMKLFEYLSQDLESRRIFDEAMTGLSIQVSQAVVQAYDFSGIKQIVDVGGGQGTLVAAILEAHAELRGILFDLPAAVENARKQVALERLASRCEVVAGNFFEHVPPGADCYLLASVIHDWDDERGLRILTHCRKAMDQGGKLLLVECVVADSSDQPFSTLLDLQMLVVTGGRERTETQFAELLAAAGFRLTRVIQTEVPECIIEAVAI
ncbi:MAG TPA: methyltransferase [Pyrinomonadaceae bacterium]|nr:methyltransferase [Pyrinomonadaceae bacterium]